MRIVQCAIHVHWICVLLVKAALCWFIVHLLLTHHSSWASTSKLRHRISTCNWSKVSFLLEFRLKSIKIVRGLWTELIVNVWLVIRNYDHTWAQEAGTFSSSITCCIWSSLNLSLILCKSLVTKSCQLLSFAWVIYIWWYWVIFWSILIRKDSLHIFKILRFLNTGSSTVRVPIIWVCTLGSSPTHTMSMSVIV